jgi:hydrogenase expression/formation protein HypC
LASIDTYKEILELMDEEDRKRAILEDDECEARGEQYAEEIKS